MALAITNLMILTDKNAKPPDGWKKYPTDLNEGAGGADLFLAYYRDPLRQSPENWITELDVVKGPSNSIDKKWTTATDSSGAAVDLNQGTNKKGDELYLVYKRGGPLRPIVGLEVCKSRTEYPQGYEVIAQDMNSNAKGSDLFLAFLRKNRTLTIGRLTCMTPSSGYGGLAKGVVNTAMSATGAALGTIAGVAIGATTGPGAIAIVLGGSAGGAAVGTAIAEGINAVATSVGTSISDDVGIRVNGTKVWPPHLDGRHKMKAGDFVDVDFVSPFQDELRVSIVEGDNLVFVIKTDMVEDLLGEMIFTTKAGQTGTYLFFNTDEGSTYAVDIIVDNTSPQIKITNKRNDEIEVVDASNKVVAKLKSNTSKLLPTMAGENWKVCIKGDLLQPVATYKATDAPDQFLVIPTPKLTVTNSTKERIHIYDPFHIRETSELAAGASQVFETFPSEVWSFLGDSDRMQKYTATDELEQAVSVTMPYLNVNNKMNVAVRIRGSRKRDWDNMDANTARFHPTHGCEIWTFQMPDGTIEKYVASDVTEQRIIIEDNKLVYPT